MLAVRFDRRAEPEGPVIDGSWVSGAVFLLRLDFLLDEAEAEFAGSCILAGGGGSELPLGGLDIDVVLFPFRLRAAGAGVAAEVVEASGTSSETFCRLDRREDDVGSL